MQIPGADLGNMNVIFPEFLSGLNRAITRCEPEQRESSGDLSLEDIKISTLKKTQDSSKLHIPSAHILKIREPLCPGKRKEIYIIYIHTHNFSYCDTLLYFSLQFCIRRKVS